MLGAVTWNEIRSKCYEVLRGISRKEGGGILLSLSWYIGTCAGGGWRLASGVVVVVVVVVVVIIVVICGGGGGADE